MNSAAGLRIKEIVCTFLHRLTQCGWRAWVWDEICTREVTGVCSRPNQL